MGNGGEEGQNYFLGLSTRTPKKIVVAVSSWLLGRHPAGEEAWGRKRRGREVGFI